MPIDNSVSKRRAKEQEEQIKAIYAAQKRPIKRLVFAGGGAKGVVYPGAYRALKNSGVLNGVTDIAGSSAGAITAALIAVGASINTIRKTSLTVDMTSLLGARVKAAGEGVVRPVTKDGNDLFNFIKEQIAAALQLVDVADLQQKLAKLRERTKDEEHSVHSPLLLDLLAQIRTGRSDLNFAQLNILHQLYPQRFKNLTVTAVNLSHAKMQQFDYRNTPQVSIALACRASASIPIALQPVAIEIDGNKAFYIDGGMANNLPVNLISDPAHPEETMVFAFGEGKKAGMHFGTDRVEQAIHYSHWSEVIERNFLENFFRQVIKQAQAKSKSGTNDVYVLRAAVHAVLKTLAANDDYMGKTQELQLKKYLLAAVNHVMQSQTHDSEHLVQELASTCFARIKQIKLRIYEPHLLERLGQNTLPRLLLNLKMPIKSTDNKYEDFRRIHDEFPLRTVDLHVGPVGTVDFKKATKLARVMDAVGYADTIEHILNHDLATDPKLDNYYHEVNQHFVTIYRALLIGTGKNPQSDSFLTHWHAQLPGNNQFDAIKSFVIKNSDSPVAFAFTRAIEFQDNLIDRDTLLKETYLEAFKKKFFAQSKSLGVTFFRAHSLEKAIKETPSLIPSLDVLAAAPLGANRLSSIAHILQFLPDNSDIELNNYMSRTI